MLGISLAWVLLGIVVFNTGQSLSRKQGSLGRC